MLCLAKAWPLAIRRYKNLVCTTISHHTIHSYIVTMTDTPTESEHTRIILAHADLPRAEAIILDDCLHEVRVRKSPGLVLTTAYL